MLKNFNRRRRGERGETLVEFAFAAVVFLTTIFVVIEFGIAVFKYNIISNLAQDGARWASVRGATSAAVQNATTTDVANYVQARAFNIPLSPAPVATWSNASKLPPETVTVVVSTPVTPLTSLIPLTITMTASATMTLSR